MATLPRMTGMLSALVDHQTKDLILSMKGEDGSTNEIRLHPGIVGGLAVAMIGLGHQMAPDRGASGLVGQVMRLNGAKPAVGQHGELVLDLILENDFHFAVTFPPQAIRGLQTALGELQKTTTPPPRGPHTH